MSRFNDWLRSRGGRKDDEEPEYYEDTHDENGNYVGRNAFGGLGADGDEVERMGVAGKNIVVYRPKSPEEVQMLITFLRKGESAVANLNEVDELRAQRMLDFLSGAVFALGGSVYRIVDNIFLLSPSGVGIQSYQDNNPSGGKNVKK